MWRCQSCSWCLYHCGITTVYITQTTRRSKKISVAPWWGTWHETAIHINNVYWSVLKQGGCHKNSHLLQFVARNRKTMAGKVHKQITQNATPGCPRSLFYIGFFVFCFLLLHSKFLFVPWTSGDKSNKLLFFTMHIPMNILVWKIFQETCSSFPYKL